MDINQLIEIIKNKLNKNIDCDNIKVEDKTFLHKKHENHTKGKYHLKIIIYSKELMSKNKIDSNKEIYKLLNEEMKKYIHSLQISLN